MAAVVIASAPGLASALALGPASLTSRLGEPLRLSLPVALGVDENVGCVQVRPQAEGLPSVGEVRPRVVRSGSQTRIELTSVQRIDEPAIAVSVSVGCVAPVSRNYAFFLDPPSLAPPAVAASSRVAPRFASTPTTTTRRAARPRAATGDTVAVPRMRSRVEGSPSRVDRTTDVARMTPAVPVPTPRDETRTWSPPAPPRAVEPAPPPAPVAKAEPDRLTVNPGGGVATTAPPASTSTTAAPPPAAPVPPPTVAPMPDVAASSAPPADATLMASAASTAAVAEREERLRRDQADLQRQVAALNDQIGAMRTQTSTLTARNQQLESSTSPPWLTWVLTALALLAILVAGWMAWRYAQLRRSVAGSPWWGANTVGPAATTMGDLGTRDDALPPLTQAANVTRAPSPGRHDQRADTAMAAAASTSAAQAATRSRTARDARYASAIDTDFTVSDIEAAMATVRTVTPPRHDAGPHTEADLSASDFAPLAGPSLPMPLTQPPAASPARPVTGTAAPSNGVDLDLPPVDPSARPAPDPLLDFALDIPAALEETAIGAAYRTTIVTNKEPPADVPSTPSALDFELSGERDAAASTPAASVPPDDAPFERTDANLTSTDLRTRHGATALADLFSETGTGHDESELARTDAGGDDEYVKTDSGFDDAYEKTDAGVDDAYVKTDTGLDRGPDTALQLDGGAPLSTTEVDRMRLVTTVVEDQGGGGSEAAMHFKLGRFADILNQVDEAARVDPLQAISLLRQHVLRDEDIPTLLWLRLFELYRQVDKRPVYEALAEHFARRFHRAMVPWDEPVSARTPQTPLSALGSLDREIEAMWGSWPGLERLRSLLCDRDQPDAVIFNVALQRDLLDVAKVFPLPPGSPSTVTR